MTAGRKRTVQARLTKINVKVYEPCNLVSSITSKYVFCFETKVNNF